MGDTFFIPFEHCQRWAIRLDRFDMGSEQLRMPGLGQLSACTKTRAYFARQD